METIDRDISSDSDLIIDNRIKLFLAETSKWANFLSIIGFVMLGLMVIVSFVMIAMTASILGAEALGIGVMYLFMVALYFFPTLYLFKFARKIKAGILSTSQEDMTQGFENLKKLFKFMGILMIVLLGFYALVLLISLFAGLSNF